MNSAAGTHFLKNFGIKGVWIQEDKTPDRYVCSCGNVENMSTCSACGNTDFQRVNRPWNSRYYTNFSIHQTDTLYTNDDDASIPNNKACVKSLNLEIDTSGNQFIFSTTYNVVIEVEENKITINRPNSMRSIDFRDFIVAHAEKLFAENKKLFDSTIEIEEVLYDNKESPNLYGENGEKTMSSFSEAFSFAIARNSHLKMSLDEMHQFKTFFHSYASKIAQMKEIVFTIDELLKALALPLCFKDYYKLYGHARSYYSYDNFKEEDVIIPLRNVFTYSLMHGQLKHDEILSIFKEASKMTSEEQNEFMEFYIKNVTFLKTSVLSRYNQIKKSFVNLPVKTKVDVKTAAIIETTEYMKKRGLNETRIEAFFNIFEKDPLVALDFLAERKKLSPEEKEIADSFI